MKNHLRLKLLFNAVFKMLDHLKIISGPKYKTELPSMSLGKYLYDVLRKGNTEDVLAVSY